MNGRSRRSIIPLACEAVEILLWMGEESFRPEDVRSMGNPLPVSPLAGRELRLDLTGSMCVGPDKVEGVRHVTLRFDCDGYDVQAYCLVTCGGDGPIMLRAHIYVNGQPVVQRDVVVEDDGSLRPGGMPALLSLADSRRDPLVCDTCGVRLLHTVQHGRYFTLVIDASVTNPQAAAMHWPSRTTKLTAQHLEDSRHTVNNR